MNLRRALASGTAGGALLAFGILSASPASAAVHTYKDCGSNYLGIMYNDTQYDCVSVHGLQYVSYPLVTHIYSLHVKACILDDAGAFNCNIVNGTSLNWSPSQNINITEVNIYAND